MHIVSRLAPTLGLVVVTTAAQAATFNVNNTADDGSVGTLRWAINQNNAINLGASPTRNTIIIQPGVYKPAGPRPLPLTANGQSSGGEFLPPFVGPVDVIAQGTVADPANPDQEPSVVIDGSNLITPYTPSECPGATFAFDFSTGKWTATSISGTGPNVRGYYGAGLAVYDSHDVTFTGMKVQHFCSGFGTVRSNNVTVRNVKVVDSYGTAGMFMTGDNGSSGSTTLSFNNSLLDSVMIDNGDGFEFTRGTHDSVMSRNFVTLTQPPPANGAGNALEFATAGNNNTVSHNTFTNHTQTALTLGSGTGHLIEFNNISHNQAAAVTSSGAGNIFRYNTFTDNNAGISVTGANSLIQANTIANNRGIGVNLSSTTATGIRVTQNAIYGNTGLGIDLAPAGVNVNDVLDADGGGNGGQNYPTLDVAASDWSAASGIVLRGVFNSAPNQTYTLEFFAARGANASGYGEGQVYLGTMTVSTDASGNASFVFPQGGPPAGWTPRSRQPAVFKIDNPFGDGTSTAAFSATATDSAGSTSEFSQALQLFRH